MQLDTPHRPLLLGFAVFRHRQKKDNVKSFHIYKKEPYLHTVQQEFQRTARVLEEIRPPVHCACICGDASHVKRYMELMTANQRRAGWQCLLDFCTTPPSRKSHSPLTETESLVANALSIANALLVSSNDVMNWEYSPWIFPSISACLKGYESFEPAISNQTSNKELTDAQRLQVALWQQWGSDLELGSPRLSRAFELHLLKKHSNNELSSVYGDASSPSSSSSSSSNVHLFPWMMHASSRQSPKMTNNMPGTQSDETLDVNVVGAACTFLSPQSSFESLLGESAMNCDTFANVPLLDLNQVAVVNAVDLPIGNKMNGCYDHSSDGGMSQPMSSASNTYSSGDERGLEVEYGETLNESREFKVLGVKKPKLKAKFHKSASSRAGSGRLSKLTKAELAHYFNMPITQASKELNVGLTVLKKRCRIFGIPRWPHRKMKSINGLIQNIQDLVKTDISGANVKDSNQVQVAVEELEKQKKEMQECPSIQLPEKTKRLRQACFKASYRKRRQALNDHGAYGHHDHETAPAHVNESELPSVQNSHRGIVMVMPQGAVMISGSYQVFSPGTF